MNATLSRILIDPQTRGGRRLLTNPQAMHAAVKSMFPPDIDESGTRVLWRVDHDPASHTHTLYVAGPEHPKLAVMVEQAGWLNRPGDTADYDRFLASLVTGQEWAFRFVGNPVKSLSQGPGRRGRVIPHVTPAQQTQWFLDKAERHGFEPCRRFGRPGVTGEEGTGEPDVTVTGRKDLSFSRSAGPGAGRNQVVLRTARFDGVLRITDVEEFRLALRQGVGRGKAYGCGLISLSHVGG